jgi:PAS domain S-box-containing protein
LNRLNNNPTSLACNAILQALPQAVILVKNDLTVVLVNTAALNLFGISESNSESIKVLSDLFNSEPANNQTETSRLEEAIRNFKGQSSISIYESLSSSFHLSPLALNEHDLIQISIAPTLSDEKIFTKLFQDSADAIFIIDKETREILEMNDLFVEHIGYSKAELLRMTACDIDKRMTEIQVNDIRSKVIDDGEIWLEHIHIHKSGQEIPVDIRAKQVQFKEKECYQCLVRDISEKKTESQLEIEKSKQRFRQLTETTKEAFWLTDWISKETLYISPAYESVYGGSVKELMENSKSWTNQIHKDDYEWVTKEYAEKGFKGEYDIEFRVVHPDGQIKWVHERAYPIYENEEVVRIAGYSIDITAKKEALLAMASSETKYKSLFDEANDAIFILNSKTKEIVEVNDKACESLGYSKSELIGQRTTLFDIEFDPIKRRWISDEIDEHGIVKFEHGHIRKDATTFPIEIISKKIIYEGIEVFQSQCRDISDRKRAEAEVQRSYKEILFAQNLSDAAEKGAQSNYLIHQISDGIKELVNPDALRLYSYNSITETLSIEVEEIDPTVLSKVEALAQIKTKSVIPDVKLNSFIQKLIRDKEIVVISELAERKQFIEEHTKNKVLKRLAPFVVKLMKIEEFILLPILSGNEVIGIISLTLACKLTTETMDAVSRYMRHANNILNKLRTDFALTSANEKYTDLIDNLKDAVISQDEYGYITFSNAAAQNLFGYSYQEIIKLKIADVIHPLDRVKSSRFYSELRSSGFNANYIGRIITKHGETKYIELSSTAVLDENSEFKGSRDIVRDITIRKLQEKNQHVQQVLLENVAKGVEFELIVQQALLSMEEVRSGEILASVFSYNRIDHQFEMVGCNLKKYTQFLESIEFSGMYPTNVIDETTVEDYARFKITDPTIIESYSSVGYAFPIVSRRLGIKGVIVLFFDTDKNITSEEFVAINSINNILKISIEHHQNKDEIRRFTENLEAAVERRTIELRNEIFERRMIEKELEKSKTLAETASSAKTSFLANMSHEIRSPLNAILGFSQILKGMSVKEGLSNKSQQFLDNIEMSSKSLSAIINDILDLSKIESGKLELDTDDYELEQIIKNIYHLNKSAASEKELLFSYKIDELIPTYLHGDRTKVMQLLMNLVSNAIKFTPSGKHVKIEALKKADQLILVVSDQGIGIDTYRIDRIFEPFEQEDTSITRKFGGSGLGLAISKRIVDLMDGTISAESEKFKGSTFTISIPLIPGSFTARSKSSITDFDDVKFSEDYKVVLVEDNLLNQELVKSLMEQIGVELIIADNGMEGIAQIKKHKPNAVLMDMHMPVMDGLETIRRIKSDTLINEIPIIAYSADAFAETQKKAFDIGVVDYLTKPLDLSKLIATLLKFNPIAPAELNFNGENIDQAVNAIQISDDLKSKIQAHITIMLATPIFESEILLMELEAMKSLALENKIGMNGSIGQITDAIYNGNQNELKEHLTNIL